MMIPSMLHTRAEQARRSDGDCDALIADLNLERLFQTMAAGDAFLHRVARQEMTQGADLDAEGILFRQRVLADGMRHAEVFQDAYGCLTSFLDNYRSYQKSSLPSFSTFIAATSVLKDTVALMRILFDGVQRLMDILRPLDSAQCSAGVAGFLQAFFGFFHEDFLAGAYGQMEELERACGDSYALITAGVGGGLKANQYVMQSISQSDGKKRNGGPSREIALGSIGIQAQAGALRDAGLLQIARMLREVNDKTVKCLEGIRYDFGFCVGCIRLCRALRSVDVPVSFPRPLGIGEPKFAFQNLMDGCLALNNQARPVGNSMDMEDFRFIMVTGANQGGKSTFLRSVGAAQLMMQCGMFVCADYYIAGCCSEVFTHFCHSEAQDHNQGRLHEELQRIDGIVQRCGRDALVLMNETFSSTSEHEASCLAEEIVLAFHELGIRTIYVTHFYEFAKNMERKDLPGVHFFAAQRQADGTRRFSIEPALPQRTSFGMDIFDQVFSG